MKNLVFAAALRAVCVATSLIGFAAFAQGNGVLTGNVIDAATKVALADVVVTATSPNLQGEQVVVTDSSGLYRLPQLPPGTYSLRLEKDGYKPLVRGDISLRIDQTLRYNAELLPEAILGETIVVVARAPSVDVGSTQLSTSVNSEVFQKLPLAAPGGKHGGARSFESLAELAPTGQPDRYGFSLNGATSNENGFLIDGLSVNDPAYGSLGSPLTLDFIQEVNIISGGYMPEFGRSTGGIYDVVTKSGSNEFHGSVFSYFSPGGLDGNASTITQQANAITTTTRAFNIGSLGAELGGPIVKDRIWFYAGFSPSFSRYRLERNLNVLNFDASGARILDSNGLQTTSRIPGTQQFYFADERSYQYIGKVTLLIDRNNSLTLSVYGTPTNSGGNNAIG
ncbi:MAG TPA: TonB-dependent receptor, partial [Myxococcaceae bacterium]|nr:TonB-dependent receptor [Myxococcaceae bacterium]